MATVKKKTIEEFMAAIRGGHAVMLKLSSYKFERIIRGRRKLKRAYNNYSDTAEDKAGELEDQCKRAMCADDFIGLAEIVCRATNTPLETFIDILEMFDLELTE